MMLYQIMTEDTGRDNITAILDAHFQGYTIVKATGRWEGIPEPSLVIEIEAYCVEYVLGQQIPKR
jgi:hypothetical protein